MYNFIYICTRTSMYTMIDNVYIYIYIYIYESGLRIPGPPPMVWSPKLTLSGTRDTGHGTIHTYIRTYVRTYVHTYRHTQTYIPIYPPTYLPAYIPTYLRTYVPTYTRTYIHTCMHACMDAYIHTYIHTYQHTNIPTEPYHHPRPQGGDHGCGGGGLGVLGHIYIYIYLIYWCRTYNCWASLHPRQQLHRRWERRCLRVLPLASSWKDTEARQATANHCARHASKPVPFGRAKRVMVRLGLISYSKGLWYVSV